MSRRGRTHKHAKKKHQSRVKRVDAGSKVSVGAVNDCTDVGSTSGASVSTHEKHEEETTMPSITTGTPLPQSPAVRSTPGTINFSMHTYMIPVEKLRIPIEYQRKIDWKRVRKMVREFDIELFTPLEVCLREDGYYYVMDGQHHFETGKIVGAKEMPCFVRNKTAVSDEAAFFREKNSCQRPPTPKALFKAGLAEGDPAVVELQKVFDILGITLSDRRGPQRITAIGELMRLVEVYGVKIVGTSLMLSVNSWPNDPANCSFDLIGGLCAFVHKYRNIMSEERFYQRFSNIKLPEIIKKFDQITIAQNIASRSTSQFKREVMCKLLVERYNRSLKPSARLEI